MFTFVAAIGVGVMFAVVFAVPCHFEALALPRRHERRQRQPPHLIRTREEGHARPIGAGSSPVGEFGFRPDASDQLTVRHAPHYGA